MAADWRYLAQHALTGEWLNLDLPLQVEAGGLRWDLSGSGALTGTIGVEYTSLRWTDGQRVLGPWASKVYAEHNGRLMWGGLVQRSNFNGAAWQVECIGMSGYANGIPYLGPYYKKVGAQPGTIFRDIWNHIQAQPDGNLGFSFSIPAKTGAAVGTTEEPYELAWWEAPDCGTELSQLATEGPFDWTETHTWAGTSQTVVSKIVVGYPRLGRRRTDLKFVQGDNILRPVEADRDGSEFAQHVITLGKGEGSKTLRGEDGVRDGRLRRPYVYTDKLAGTTARCNALARRERGRRGVGYAVESVTVQDHPNAPLGSWALGDDILIEAEVQHVGYLQDWYRVTSWALNTDSTAVLTVARADSFTYGA